MRRGRKEEVKNCTSSADRHVFRISNARVEQAMSFWDEMKASIEQTS